MRIQDITKMVLVLLSRKIEVAQLVSHLGESKWTAIICHVQK